MEQKTGQMIDKEVFDAFFRENYCTLEYGNVRNDFEEIAVRGKELFVPETDFSKVTRKNFILYLTNEAYCEFEAVVEESFDSLNPEIVDAVMDISTSMQNEDEITGLYWSTCEELLKQFLRTLYEEKLEKEIADADEL